VKGFIGRQYLSKYSAALQKIKENDKKGAGFECGTSLNNWNSWFTKKPIRWQFRLSKVNMPLVMKRWWWCSWPEQL